MVFVGKLPVPRFFRHALAAQDRDVMLTIIGPKQRFCDGISRRNFLKIGALGLGGLTLPQILQAEAQSGIRKSHKAVIMIYLPGGPPHQDMFDLKLSTHLPRSAVNFAPSLRACRASRSANTCPSSPARCDNSPLSAPFRTAWMITPISCA